MTYYETKHIIMGLLCSNNNLIIAIRLITGASALAGCMHTFTVALTFKVAGVLLHFCCKLVDMVSLAH